MEGPQVYKDVTLLITHYNRSSSLERLLRAFSDIGVWFEDVVVSDDCSRKEHLSRVKALQKEFSFRLITTPENKGLAHNINKGEDAVKTPFILYVQEDFVPKKEFSIQLPKALSILVERKDIDIIRFYAYFRYHKLKPCESGYSDMVFCNWIPHYRIFHLFSCHPHLKRSNFSEKFGRFDDSRIGFGAEFNMCLSFIKRDGKALFYDNYWELFEQKNCPDEPSVIGRGDWRQSNNFFIRSLRFSYHCLLFTISTLLTKNNPFKR